MADKVFSIVTARPTVSRKVPSMPKGGINPSPKKRVHIHCTGRGESLSAIAKKYGMDWQTLANANRARLTTYRDPSFPVNPGTNLVIP